MRKTVASKCFPKHILNLTDRHDRTNTSQIDDLKSRMERMEQLITALVQASGGTVPPPHVPSIPSPPPTTIDTLQLAGSSSMRSIFDRPIRPLPARAEGTSLSINKQPVSELLVASVSPVETLSGRRRELGQENDHERFQVRISPTPRESRLYHVESGPFRRVSRVLWRYLVMDLLDLSRCI